MHAFLNFVLEQAPIIALLLRNQYVCPASSKKHSWHSYAQLAQLQRSISIFDQCGIIWHSWHSLAPKLLNSYGIVGRVGIPGILGIFKLQNLQIFMKVWHIQAQLAYLAQFSSKICNFYKEAQLSILGIVEVQNLANVVIKHSWHIWHS